MRSYPPPHAILPLEGVTLYFSNFFVLYIEDFRVCNFPQVGRRRCIRLGRFGHHCPGGKVAVVPYQGNRKKSRGCSVATASRHSYGPAQWLNTESHVAIEQYPARRISPVQARQATTWAPLEISLELLLFHVGSMALLLKILGGVHAACENRHLE